MRTHPPCFHSTAAYTAWRSAAKFIPPGPSGYCADCSPAYQAQEIARGECEFPGTQFDHDEDGFVTGRRCAKATP